MIKNISHLTIFSFVILLSSKSFAETQARGHLFVRLSSYTQDAPKNYGQESRSQLEAATDFNGKLSALNQLRFITNSLNSDLSVKSTPDKKDIFTTYLGENYLKYKSESWVAQLGYQEVVWGEAFGFNYADIINPKDQRETLYSDAPEARLPLLLFNGKAFFSEGDLSGSLQMLYSPEPRFSKTLPVELIAGNLLSQSSISVKRERTPKIFKNSELGGKFSLSYAGFDVSAFHFSYLDRDPHYSLESATLTSVALKEEHNKIKSSGFSLAKTVYDYVFRTDLVLTKNKTINYLDNVQLKSNPSRSFNALVSIDSPTYNDYSGVLIFAQSSLKELMPNSFRYKDERYMIGKISKNLANDKSIEFSYTHEFQHTGHAIQTLLNWPVTSSTDIKLGGQFYFGENQSILERYKNVSSIFFSLKNYFQL